MSEHMSWRSCRVYGFRRHPRNAHRLGCHEGKEDRTAEQPQHCRQVKRQLPIPGPRHNHPRSERTKDAGRVFITPEIAPTRRGFNSSGIDQYPETASDKIK
jgi:hypothetical protein